MIEFTHVPGTARNRIVLYALSTCGWCRKTKNLLDELGIAYDYVDVDFLGGDKSAEARREVTRWNPRCSFPTLVIDGSRCIVGFDEEEIRKLG
jgi:glutaredoxin